MYQLSKRLNALERLVPQEQPAYVLLVPDEDGRLIGPDGRVWEDDTGTTVIDLDVTDGAS
jgi:hypothetical protein